MNHLNDVDLALYSSGDLSFVERWRMSRHVKSCAECAREVEGYRTVSHIASNSREQLPEGLAWGHLAAEMKANIHLGLEAGRVVGPVEDSGLAWHPWRAAAVFASVAVMAVSGFMLSRPDYAETGSQEIVLSAGKAGVEVSENGGTMVLMESDAKLGTVSGNGSVRRRHINEETGEVTILNVYAQ
jgi:anti-sigma factor RsiW